MHPQPKWNPSMIAKTRQPIVTTDSNPPIQSMRPSPWAFDGGTRTSAATIARAAIGTLMRKVECHERVSSNHPASSGPQGDGETGRGRPRGDGAGALGGRERRDQEGERRGHDESRRRRP